MNLPFPVIVRNGILWAVIHIATNEVFIHLKVGFNLTAFFCITIIGIGLLLEVGYTAIKKRPDTSYKLLLFGTWLTTFIYTFIYIIYHYYSIVIKNDFEQAGPAFFIVSWFKGTLFFLILSAIVSFVIFRMARRPFFKRKV